MSFPNLTLDVIRQHANSASYSRGREYFSEGAVLSVTQRGDTIEAEVVGSHLEPYLVTATFRANGEFEVDCDCPYEGDGWCKHIVATLLVCLNKPDTIEVEEAEPEGEAGQATASPAMLASLSAEALRKLIGDLLKRHPDLENEVASLIALSQVLPASATETSAPTITVPLDPAPFRKRLQGLSRSSRRRNSRYDDYDYYDEDYDEMDEIISEVSEVLGEARALVQAGDGRNAVVILDVLTDEYYRAWKKMDDEMGTGGEYFSEIGRVWTEAMLSADWTPQERKSWAAKLKVIQRQIERGNDDALLPAIAAVEQGWDYPPLLRVFQNEITEKGAWEGEAPDYADELAVARLNVLERLGRLQEALYLAEAESQYPRYMHIQVKMGRIEEAVKDGLEILNSSDEAYLLAQAILERGDGGAALRIAEHGLSLPGSKTALANWTRDLAWLEEQTNLAVRAATISLRETPNLRAYEWLEGHAGDAWPKLRAEMLDALRQLQHWDRTGIVDILLYEGLIEDALNAIKNSGNYDLIIRVVEAAIPTHPNEAIAIAKAQAEVIMDNGKADRYNYAADWLRRVRDAYRVLGEETQWRTYKERLLSLHQKKYKLRPMIEAL